jgi:predicted nucleotidyltransferase
VDGRARWNGESLVHWGSILVAELAAEFHPIEVWLFGSVARGDDDADSDLDLLVVLDRYDTSDAIALKRRAARAASVPAPFDVSFTDVTRMAARRHIAGTIERAAAREGALKYSRG